MDEVFHWGETRTVFDPQNFTVEEDSEGIYNEPEEDDINGVRILQNPLENQETLTAFYKSRSFVPKLVWTKCPSPAGVALAPWDPNFLYITSSYNQTVLIMDLHKTKLVGKLTAPEMLCPQSVAFSKKRKEIYVSDKSKHCIHVFTNSGEHIRVLSSKGCGEGKLRRPEGLAVSTADEIVVCDTGNDRVVILRPDDGKQVSNRHNQDSRIHESFCRMVQTIVETVDILGATKVIYF